MTLSTNMRTLLTDDSDSAQFAALLLGSGLVSNINSQNILVDHRYGHVVHTIDDLIQKIYEDVQTNLNKTTHGYRDGDGQIMARRSRAEKRYNERYRCRPAAWHEKMELVFLSNNIL